MSGKCRLTLIFIIYMTVEILPIQNGQMRCVEAFLNSGGVTNFIALRNQHLPKSLIDRKHTSLATSITDDSTFQQCIGSATSEGLAYEVRAIQGKGFGAVALRDIFPGEMIIVEKPLFSISTKKGWFTPSESYSETRVENEVEKLSPGDQERFYSLHGYMGQNKDTNDDITVSKNAVVMGGEKIQRLKMPPIIIYRTNAYPAGAGKSGLFPLISRLNSDCTPNVHYNWNEKQGSSTVYCVSKISKGEEIVNCYMGLYINRLERLEYLNKNFGFSCLCKSCSLSGVAQVDSDTRRMRLGSLEEMTVTAILEKKKNLALDLVNLRLEILKEEGLENSMTSFKCEYDAFLAIAGLNSSISSLVDDISGSADSTSSRESNGEMLELSTMDAEDMSDAKEWLKKAYEHVVEAKGPESVESHKCFYYLSIFNILY